ncbi:hypothetical protein [Oceaniradius stylonematis]|uniref:hypothetical protein n=1 Tax=Oceaniradius stylonematis TaxID=2184161 RepID=UPI00273D71A0|nr:hypothetical protein [Oceaniradius stylonematis]
MDPQLELAVRIVTNDNLLDQIADRHGGVGIVGRDAVIERLRQVLHVPLVAGNRRGVQ